MTDEIDLKLKKAPLYKCKKCGFIARGLVGVCFAHDWSGEGMTMFNGKIADTEKELMPAKKFCYKCWYDWHVANLGELEVVEEK